MNRRQRAIRNADAQSDWGAAVYGLNLLDLGWTLAVLRLGAEEQNPLLQIPLVMVLYKTFLVWGLTQWLSEREERAAQLGLKLCFAVYGALNAYHVIGLFLIGEIYA